MAKVPAPVFYNFGMIENNLILILLVGKSLSMAQFCYSTILSKLTRYSVQTSHSELGPNSREDNSVLLYILYSCVVLLYCQFLQKFKNKQLNVMYFKVKIELHMHCIFYGPVVSF